MSAKGVVNRRGWVICTGQYSAMAILISLKMLVRFHGNVSGQIEQVPKLLNRQSLFNGLRDLVPLGP